MQKLTKANSINQRIYIIKSAFKTLKYHLKSTKTLTILFYPLQKIFRITSNKSLTNFHKQRLWIWPQIPCRQHPTSSTNRAPIIPWLFRSQKLLTFTNLFFEEKLLRFMLWENLRFFYKTYQLFVIRKVKSLRRLALILWSFTGLNNDDSFVLSSKYILLIHEPKWF